MSTLTIEEVAKRLNGCEYGDERYRNCLMKWRLLVSFVCLDTRTITPNCVEQFTTKSESMTAARFC